MSAKRFRISTALTIAAIIVLVGSEPASARPRWSEWSTPVAVSELNVGVDGTPAETKDGLTLYFASSRSGYLGGVGDIWVAHRASTDAVWGAPAHLGINSVADDYGPALSRDGHWLFWNSNRSGGAGLQDLYTSYRRHTHEDFGENGWQAASPVVSLNTASGESNPSYFQDDETGRSYLFFQSNRPGGLGLQDIWMAEQQPDGSFGPASNVTALNSTLGEGRPTVSHDGLEIIFMSTRTGAAVQHLWSATRESTSAEWSAPVFLTSVNSAIHDGYPHLSPDGQRLYVVRSPTGAGPFSIYVSTRTKETGKP